nr:hypothetical protein [Tanacetum cinerariifolium]
MEEKRGRLSRLLLKGHCTDFRNLKPQISSTKRTVTQNCLKLQSGLKGDQKLQEVLPEVAPLRRTEPDKARPISSDHIEVVQKHLRKSSHLGEAFESDRAGIPRVSEKVWFQGHNPVKSGIGYSVSCSGKPSGCTTETLQESSSGYLRRHAPHVSCDQLSGDCMILNLVKCSVCIYTFFKIPLLPSGAFRHSIMYSFDLPLPLHHMSFGSQSVGDAVVPKIDMHTYTSTMTADKVKSLVEE